MERNLEVYFVSGVGGEALCSVTSRELMLELPGIEISCELNRLHNTMKRMHMQIDFFSDTAQPPS